MGNSPFPGTQNYLNSAIGTSNAAINSAAGAVNTPTPMLSGVRNPAATPANPNSPFSNMNQYLPQYYNAAALPMVQNYQNAVAPNLLSNFASSGTVGGTGQQQAFGLAESGLAQGLGTLGANIYEPAWQQSQGIASNQAMQTQALESQANMQKKQLSAQAALANQGTLAGEQGLGANILESQLGMVPSLASSAYIPSQQLFSSGGVGQNQAQNVLNSAYGNLYQQGQWPYTELQQLGAGLGNYPQGSGTSQTTMSGQGSMK